MSDPFLRDAVNLLVNMPKIPLGWGWRESRVSYDGTSHDGGDLDFLFEQTKDFLILKVDVGSCRDLQVIPSRDEYGRQSIMIHCIKNLRNENCYLTVDVPKNVDLATLATGEACVENGILTLKLPYAVSHAPVKITYKSPQITHK
jgi:hypothetical protein